jgi:hypothetical protein
VPARPPIHADTARRRERGPGAWDRVTGGGVAPGTRGRRRGDRARYGSGNGRGAGRVKRGRYRLRGGRDQRGRVATGTTNPPSCRLACKRETAGVHPPTTRPIRDPPLLPNACPGVSPTFVGDAQRYVFYLYLLLITNYTTIVNKDAEPGNAEHLPPPPRECILPHPDASHPLWHTPRQPK